MSNDENSNESVESVEEVEAPAAEVNEAVSEVDAEDGGNAISKVMALKESNPKVFFGAIGGLVLLVLVVMMMGGNNNAIPSHKAANLVIGNTYTLKGINSYGSNVTIRLVAVPGSMAAYDESEKEGNDSSCKNIPQGTQVKLKQVQQAFGNAKFVQLEILGDSPCVGKTGWASANNLS